MKPILIINHVECAQPGYLCEFLAAQNIPYTILHLENHKLLPHDIEKISGMVLLGAPVSVNDGHQWITDELKLVKHALQSKLPVLGICFGAQLIAKSLNATICAAAGMKIGWHHVTLNDEAKPLLANYLLNASDLSLNFDAFTWHGDTFSYPADAIPLFQGKCIKNQGFIYNNSLALQFHPEITELSVKTWLDRYSDCLLEPDDCVQSKASILENFDERLKTQRKVADQLFYWWLDRVDEHRRGMID